jgi:hypothetical protein
VSRKLIGIVSDIHYAGPAEQARGNDYEWRELRNPWLRLLMRFHRRWIWLRNPLDQNHLLDQFLENGQQFDYVIANGDYTCDTLNFGISDDASFESARLCLQKLRSKFPGRVRAIMGDHELGKVSFVGGRGGMRLASWRRATEELGIEPFWKFEIGNYVFMGVTSSLVALPAFEADTLSAEIADWEQLRAGLREQIQRAFGELKPEQRVILFCHDPTALPFLAREEAVRGHLPQVEATVIGHLHTNLVLWKSRLLAGMPRITFLGHTARKLSAALRDARDWKAFNVRLCPAIAGVELLKDGGYLTAELDENASEPARFSFHSISR